MAAVQFQAGLSHLASGWKGRPAPCQWWNRPIGKFSESLRSWASTVQASLHWLVSTPQRCPRRNLPPGVLLTAEGESRLFLASMPALGPWGTCLQQSSKNAICGETTGVMKCKVYPGAARMSLSKGKCVPPAS